MAVIRTYGRGRGTIKGQLKTPETRVVKGYSSVFAAIREWQGTPGAGGYGYIAGARMTVCNLDPEEGLINYWVEIEWAVDVNYELTFLVV